MRLLRLCLILSAVSVAAQELPDAGLPDGSVGQGGADQSSEENDPNGTPCLDSKACSGGFQCVNARCVPRPVQVIGCSTTPGAALLLGVLVLSRRR